ncbi:6657_t:CDS:1, partial [Ambispora leptoticha]
KLPPSILERTYNQLLSQKRNPISLDQIIEKHDQIENHLRNALEIYEKYKARNRKKPSSTSLSIILPTNKANTLLHSSDIIEQNSDPVESILQDVQTLLNIKYPTSQNKSPIYTEEKFNT